MKPTESHIFNLSKSLSKAEGQELLRPYGTIKKAPPFIQLFAIYRKWKSYDPEREAKECSKFEWSSYLPAVKGRLKKYLYRAIISKPVGKLTPEARFRIGLELFDRGLETLALRELAKSREGLIAEENFELLIKCVRLEKALLRYELDLDKYEVVLEKLNKISGHSIEALNRIHALQQIEEKTYFQFRKKHLARGRFQMSLIGELEEKLNQFHSDPLSVREQIRLFILRMRILNFRAEFKEAGELAGKLVSLFKSKPIAGLEVSLDYMSILAQRANFGIASGNPEETVSFLEEIDSFRNKPGRLGDLANKNFLGTLIVAFRKYPEDFKSQLQERFNEYKKFIFENPGKGHFAEYYFVITYFLSVSVFEYPESFKDFGLSAREVISLIINNPRKGVKEDIQSISRLFEIALLLTNSKEEIAEVLMRRYKEYVRKRGSMFQVEQRVFSFYTQYLKLNPSAADIRKQRIALH